MRKNNNTPMRRCAVAPLLGMLGAVAGTVPLVAAASCGASFCDVNTSWGAHGAWLGSGTRVDMRYEFIDQDQARAGSRPVSVGAIRRHHDEVQTINRNTVVSLEHALDPQSSITVILPVISRSHLHIHNHRGARLGNAWNFTQAGDVRLLYQRRFQTEAFDAVAYTLSGGVKLPTGDFRVRNATDAIAERSLQPGTGTIDAMVGAAASGDFLRLPMAWFAQVALQSPINSRADFRPGAQVQADAGISYAASQRLRFMGQINTRYRWRDRGLEAEPADSGGGFVSLTPGIAYAATDTTVFYGFLQVPVYQHVNGLQLTSRWSATAGLTVRF